MAKKTPAKTPRKVRNAKAPVVQNDLQQALFPQSIGNGTQMMQVDTLIKNLRHYMISNYRAQLSEAFVEIGLIQTICTTPVDDAFRGGVEYTSKQIDENEMQELQAHMEASQDFDHCAEAHVWSRLYGGAGILIMTDQDHETPLDIDAINEKTPVEFRAVDMWELFWDKQNTEGYNPEIQEEDYSHFNYYGQKVHKSRVIKLKGMKAPSFLRPRLRGWGFSVVETLVTGLNQYLKSNNVIFEVMDEFKLDIFKFKNLAQTLMTPDGTAQIQKRTMVANMQKNYLSAMTMDAEDDYVQKQLSFAGIAETLIGIKQHIASDMKMPLTKIFGISAAGFSSGQDDIENYNAMVESTVRQKAKAGLILMAKIRCKQKYGIIPDDLKVDFKPLRVLGAEAEENVKTQKFNRLLAALEKGQITDLEFRQACNRHNLLDVQLDVSKKSLLQITKQRAEEKTTQDKKESGSVSEIPDQSVSTTTKAKESPEAKT